MHDWRGEIVGHAAMAELLVGNLLLEETPIACEEAMEAARRLHDCLARIMWTDAATMEQSELARSNQMCERRRHETGPVVEGV